jgi:predicted ribosomally synthesized peptide with nif11-like leader
MTGIQAALQFLQAARRDDAMRLELRGLCRDVTTEDLVRLAQANGFSFTADDLQRAHTIDWRLRGAYYLGGVG